ncbi:MAG TPA: translation initiation factor IF-3 [Chloroflexota bacterium]|nr:translation initiation factor IF-3 [Chloroflexota bacterium]
MVLPAWSGRGAVQEDRHISSKDLRVNNQIRARDVRLIGQNGEQLGIVPLPRALEIARSDNLDLVEVSPMAQPPVCKVLDYGKFKYEQTRKEREARKSQKTQTLKEMRFKASIAEHDIEYRTKIIENFLREGDKVKVTVTFRGRQNAHPEIGRQVLDEITQRLEGTGSVERMPLLEGRAMTMILAPAPQRQQRQPPAAPTPAGVS